MIRPQSYQYFAKLTILPVILAWAITIVACFVIGEPWFFVCSSPPLPSNISYKRKQNIRTVSQLSPNKSSKYRVFLLDPSPIIAWLCHLTDSLNYVVSTAGA